MLAEKQRPQIQSISRDRSTLLVPLVGGAEDRRCLKAAEALAKRLHAHIEALHVVADPSQQLALLALDDLPIPQEVFDEQRKRNAERAAAVSAEFSAWREAAGQLEASTEDASGRTAELQVQEGDWRDLLRDHALTADMVVATLPGRTHPQRFDALTSALFGAGRPVLAVPMQAPAPAFAPDQIAAIAWHGRAQAARAVSAALPLLREARETVILTVAAQPPSGTDRLLAYLRRHGVSPLLRCVGEDGDTGMLLHRAAHECGARFLVMGAYSRSMTRELVFGGVTEFMLKHATLPLLMAH